MTFQLPAHSFPIFDAHSHLRAHTYSAGTFSVTEASGFDANVDHAYRLRVMDSSGVRAAILMATNSYERPNGVSDTRRQNDFVAWYRDTFRDRFPIGIGTVEPLHGADAGVAEINRMASELHLDGVVWHHLFSGTSIDDPRMVVFAGELQRLHLPAFVHLNGECMFETPARLESLAEKFPDVTFVALSSLFTTQSVYEMRSLAQRCQNVMFDTSFVRPIGQVIAHFVERFGSERILFGSDLVPMKSEIYQQPPGLADIVLSERLSETDKHNILWGNAARLFPALASLA